MPETSDVVVAKIPGVEDTSLLTPVKMAHRLNERDRARLGLPLDARIVPGTTVKVLGDHARSLIAAGYAQVDPEDTKAVNDALARTQENAQSQGEGVQEGEGTDRDASAADAQVASDDPIAPAPTARNAKRGA